MALRCLAGRRGDSLACFLLLSPSSACVSAERVKRTHQTESLQGRSVLNPSKYYYTHQESSRGTCFTTPCTKCSNSVPTTTITTNRGKQFLILLGVHLKTGSSNVNYWTIQPTKQSKIYNRTTWVT